MPGSVVGVKTPQSEGCLSISINGVKKQPERVSVGTASQAEGTAHAEVLDWDSGTARMRKWPEDSERGSGEGVEISSIWWLLELVARTWALGLFRAEE